MKKKYKKRERLKKGYHKGKAKQRKLKRFWKNFKKKPYNNDIVNSFNYNTYFVNKPYKKRKHI